MAKKNQNDHYDSILTKLGFDANDFIVDQNNEYNKISSEDFTLGFEIFTGIYILKHGKKCINSLKQ